MKNFCYAILLLIISLIISACPTDDGKNKKSGDNSGDNGDNGNNVVVKTGKVTFFNESTSYKVVVHQDAFSGPVLLELSSWESKKVDVRVSDNYGVGSTFSIEYLYPITDAFDTESGDVIASGIDPNVQINLVIEENKSYDVTIPSPKNLEFRTAFIRIVNASNNLPFELRYLGTVFKQTGNGNISVAPGKTGIYKLEGIPADGKLYQNYEIVSTFASTPIPDFTVENGTIYSFTYNGTSVIKTGEQTIIFK